MTIDQLKQRVEQSRARGWHLLWGDAGPADLAVVTAIVAVVERQQREIDELRNKVASFDANNTLTSNGPRPT